MISRWMVAILVLLAVKGNAFGQSSSGKPDYLCGVESVYGDSAQSEESMSKQHIYLLTGFVGRYSFFFNKKEYIFNIDDDKPKSIWSKLEEITFHPRVKDRLIRVVDCDHGNVVYRSYIDRGYRYVYISIDFRERMLYVTYLNRPLTVD